MTTRVAAPSRRGTSTVPAVDVSIQIHHQCPPPPLTQLPYALQSWWSSHHPTGKWVDRPPIVSHGNNVLYPTPETILTLPVLHPVPVRSTPQPSQPDTPATQTLSPTSTLIINNLTRSLSNNHTHLGLPIIKPPYITCTTPKSQLHVPKKLCQSVVEVH